MILKLVDKATRQTQSYPIRSNEDFTPIIMQYPEVRGIVFYGYETADLSQDYSPRLRKIVDAVAEYLKKYNLEVSIEWENIWEMHDPLDPFEKSDVTAEEESEIIKENKKKPEASKVHDFKPAKWTHPNGHPRCLICGDEERIGGKCNTSVNKTEAFITAASMLLTLTTTFIPANLAKAEVAKQVVNVFKYRPYGHKPEDKFLQAIMELESSGGLNQNHPEPSCIGRWGLMTPTIKDMVRLFDSHNPDIKNFVNYDTAQIKQIFKKHPELELHIARILARYIIAKQKGNMAKAAYSWKYGQNTPPDSITEEKLLNEPYIQKFIEVSGKMGKSSPNDFDQKLKSWISKRKEKESNPTLWSPSEPDYTSPRDPDPKFIRDTSKLRANIARVNR